MNRYQRKINQKAKRKHKFMYWEVLSFYRYRKVVRADEKEKARRLGKAYKEYREEGII